MSEQPKVKVLVSGAGMKLPLWSKCLAGFVLFVACWTWLSNALATPQQKAISSCVAELNQAASGGLSRSQLERTCELQCVRGELDGCQ